MIKKRQKKQSVNKFAIITLLAVIVGAVIAVIVTMYVFLKPVWQEQFMIEDRESDVVITTGKMVSPEVIRYHFGLTNGANLAAIPFAELRKKIISNNPCILDMHIERRLTNRVTIDVKERTPIAWVASAKTRKIDRRVVDINGVVFPYFDLSAVLPILCEAKSPPATRGQKLKGNEIAALHLIDLISSAPELSELRVLEINTSKKDYLLLTLGNYARAKVAWAKMGEDSRESKASLKKQLGRLQAAIKTNLRPWATLWTATDYEGGRVYANNPSNPIIKR